MIKPQRVCHGADYNAQGSAHRMEVIIIALIAVEVVLVSQVELVARCA
jgi:uncharacterized Rmd1/YagE family protein